MLLSSKTAMSLRYLKKNPATIFTGKKKKRLPKEKICNTKEHTLAIVVLTEQDILLQLIG